MPQDRRRPALTLFNPLRQAVAATTPATLRADALAGLTVAVIAVPQSLAYAVLAGVPPVYGLYSVILQSLVGSLFNSQPLLSVGPINTQSLLVASIVTAALGQLGELDPSQHGHLYLQLVVALTILKGALQLAMAAANLGALVRYVSGSVLVGFTAGAGVLIAAAQVPAFLGLAAPRGAAEWPGVVGLAQRLLPHLHDTDWRSVTLGLLALAIVLGARALSRLAPGPLLAVVVSAALVAALQWTKGPLQLVGELPRGLPPFELPLEGLAHWETLLGGALALALLGLLEAYSIGRHLAARCGPRPSANQELFAQGFTNFVTGFFDCIPGSGSFSRSALNHDAGARTAFSGLFNALFVAVLFFAAAPLARFVPMTALAAVLFVIGLSLIDHRYFRRVWRSSRADAVVCFGTFAATLTLPLAYAVFTGIFLNIALYLRRASQLHMAEMVRTKAGGYAERELRTRTGASGDVIFIQIEGDLFFAVADELADKLTDLERAGYKVVIFRLKRTHSIDATVLAVLDTFARAMQRRGRHVLLCGLKDELLDKLRAYGLVDLIGRNNVFPAGYGVFTSAKAALRRAREILGSSIDEEDLDTSEDPGVTRKQGAWSYDI